MRIVSGQFKGKPIAAPEGLATRPTSDRARESIFNILAHAPWAPQMQGARVLDLFAGSGALGLESLSRGAAFCLFVETGEEARGAIRDNVESLSLYGCTRIHRRDATDLGPRPSSAGDPFGLVFLDPPYGKGPDKPNMGEKALAELAAHGWLKPGAAVVFERGADEPDIAPAGYEVVDARVYGAAKVWFLRAD